jgi:outer membrane protein assembly factor BamB
MGWGSKDIGQDTMTALNADTGEKIWTAPHPYAGYNSPEDLFVINGKVWIGRTAKGGPDGRYFGHDLKTGALDVEFPPTVKTHWFHHRCYRAKATDRFVLCSRTGIELVDLDTGEWTINHWVRGGCLYGIMPANGMIYSPPHPCACYPEAKLYGFVALAPASRAALPEPEDTTARLQHGSAYDAVVMTNTKTDQEWSTYRHDPSRSGATSQCVPDTLEPIWQRHLGGRLTQPVSGDNCIFVAATDRHLVHALDADSGNLKWSFHAGGRVDSSPTYSNGRLVFGCNDGFVYCLRTSDGELAWRFRAAPIDQRMVAFDRLESVWPVHGSVLVQEGVATFVVGRSMFLDGGLRVCRLDVPTGRLLSEVEMDDRDPETHDDLQVNVQGLNMPVALTDILSGDGEHLFMRSQVLNADGTRRNLGPSGSGHPHLFAPYGFTDDSWFHRTYWIYGDSFRGGVGGFGNGKTNPAGRMLVSDGNTVFGYGRKPQYYRWGSVIDYQLYATSTRAKDSSSEADARRKRKARGLEYLWTSDVPLFVRAMAKADNKLLVAGPRDVLDEDAAFQTFNSEDTQRQLLAQQAALDGATGALLQAIEASSGDMLSEIALSSPPVFDGMSVSGGRVYLATVDGQVVSLGE